MPSPWMLVEALMREIGSVRTDAEGLDAHEIGAAVALEIDRAIGDAAAALDVALATPDDEQLLTTVCEAIVVARQRIGRVREERERAERISARGAELARHAEQLAARNAELTR